MWAVEAGARAIERIGIGGRGDVVVELRNLDVLVLHHALLQVSRKPLHEIDFVKSLHAVRDAEPEAIPNLRVVLDAVELSRFQRDVLRRRQSAT